VRIGCASKQRAIEIPESSVRTVAVWFGDLAHASPFLRAGVRIDGVGAEVGRKVQRAVNDQRTCFQRDNLRKRIGADWPETRDVLTVDF